jgi:hypothetical protein
MEGSVITGLEFDEVVEVALEDDVERVALSVLSVEVESGSVMLKYAEVNPSGVSELIQKKKTLE